MVRAAARSSSGFEACGGTYSSAASMPCRSCSTAGSPAIVNKRMSSLAITVRWSGRICAYRLSGLDVSKSLELMMGCLLFYERGRLTALKWPCFRAIAQCSLHILCLIYSRVAAAHLARRMPYDSREGRTSEEGVLVPTQHPDMQHPWLSAKLGAFPPALRPAAAQALACQAAGDAAPTFENPFTLADLTVFDDETLCEQLCHAGRLRTASLGAALHGAPEELVRRVAACLPKRAARWRFTSKQRAPIVGHAVAAAQARLLDALFLELTYLKTPPLYDDLVEGEQLHPRIFQRLPPPPHPTTLLDAGAGSGRATLACLRAGASRV